MRKLPAAAVAGAVAFALAGGAFAASRNHVMTVALPDGSMAHVEYTGDIAPKVTITPTAPLPLGGLPPFAGFDRIIDQMNHRVEAMMRVVQQGSIDDRLSVTSPTMASFGGSPAGASSTTIVTYSDGKSTCTRKTETIWQGQGKAPKVSSTSIGNCDHQAAAPPPSPPIPVHA